MYMNESVNLKTIDVIKEMTKEKEQNIENKTDYRNILISNVVMTYFYEYVEPILIELNASGIIEYDKSLLKSNSETKRIYLKSISYIRETLSPKDDSEKVRFQNDTQGIKNLFHIFRLDKYRQLCDDKGIFFLDSSKSEAKKEFALKIKEMFIYEYKITEYSTNYIKPLLINLSKNNKIKFFANPKTEEEKNINYTIEGTMISIINQLFYVNTSFGEYNNILNIIDSNNDYDKNKLAWIIYSEIFSKEYTQEDLNKIYEDAISYTRNKNKYGLYDFNDYNKVITTIFNIK